MLDLSPDRPQFHPDALPIPHPLKARYNWGKNQTGWHLKSRITGLSYSPQAAKVLFGAPIAQ